MIRLKAHKYRPLASRLAGLLILLALFLSAGCGDLVFISDNIHQTSDKTDFTVEGLRMTISHRGKPNQRVIARDAAFMTGEGIILLNDVKAEIFDDNMEIKGTITANEGTVYIQDSLTRKKNDIDLVGNVHYVDRDGSTLDMERVSFHNEDETIRSDRPMRQSKIMNDSVLVVEGNDFHSDRNLQDIKTHGASMTIEPIETTDQQERGKL